jgi:hypothetical protein
MKIRLTESELIRLIKKITENIDNEEFDDLSLDNEKEIEIQQVFNDLENILQLHGYDKSEIQDLDREQLLMVLGEVIDNMEPGRERQKLEFFHEYVGSILYGGEDVDQFEEDPEGEKIYEDVYGSVELVNLLNEAEYKGRKVQLGKIMQGDVKKFKVFVKNDKGKVVKVNFGFGGKSAKGKRMTIKKNNPERRRSFRARHNCDNPGPRWKPRYWACRTW